MTNADSIERGRQAVIERSGPWTAHNVHLGGDVYTIGKRIVGDEIRLRRVVQMVADIAGKPLAELRVLDLACNEGLFAVELARHGAKVVGIEGREANLDKARFVKETLALDTLELVQDDVRNVSEAKYGCFDAVLCLGILYHLDAQDIFPFLEKIAEVCRGFAIFDTQISLAPEQSTIYKNKEYWGRTFVEHSPRSTAEEKAGRLWASLDNLTAFWLTRSSLCNALADVGFTSVYECLNPPDVTRRFDRVNFVAVKGQRQTIISSPLISAQPDGRLPEKSRLLGRLQTLRRLVPKGMRNTVRGLLRSVLKS